VISGGNRNCCAVTSPVSLSILTSAWPLT